MKTLSYVHGPGTPTLLEDTVGQLLATAALKWPEREALVCVEQGCRFTYDGFNQRVDAVAAGLLALGLEPGERIGIWAPNCAEWALTQFATARAGLILVNINSAYRLAELQYVLTQVGVRALILTPTFKSSDYVAMLETLAPEIGGSSPGTLQAARLPELRIVVKIGGIRRAGWLQFDDIQSEDRSRLRSLVAQLKCEHPINIQFTSGTTGAPKGATLSHRNIVNNARAVGLSMGLRAGDRLCIPVPLYHCFGMVMGNLACVAHGATMIYPSSAFDPLAVLRTVQAERCTGLFGVPTMFNQELEHPQFAQCDLTSLRGGIMAGAPCPVEVMRRVISRMHMQEVTIAYGMTETSPVSFQSAPDDALERRVTTVGRIQPHMECKIIDAQGAIVPRGTAGELCTRGYAVMLGYWGDPARTAEVVDAEGWMHTGDLGILDEEGYCSIVGRSKDMIIRGGENVYPREVEEFLYRHPKVLEVAVVGLPSDAYGEEVCAWIRLRDGAACTALEIREFCTGQIAHYKIPRHVLFVDAFPTTATGKVQKYLIRREMVRRLGAGQKDACGRPG
jgi:fatty-acyl-CoA synthase